MTNAVDILHQGKGYITHFNEEVDAHAGGPNLNDKRMDQLVEMYAEAVCAGANNLELLMIHVELSALGPGI